MAEIPGTKFAAGSPPGRTGQTYWNPPSQGGAVVKGIGQLSSALFQHAINVERKKMVVELSRKKSEIDERGWAMNEAITGDDETDRTLLETFQKDAQAIRASATYKDVGDELGLYLDDVLPNWSHAARTKSLNIQAKEAGDQMQLNARNKLSRGDIPGANEDYLNAKRTGAITEAEYNTLIAESPTESHLLIAERLLLNGDNRAALAELSKTEGMDLTNRQLKDRRTLKLTAEKNKDDVDRTLINDVMGKVAEGMPLNEVQDLIQQTLGIDNIQKAQLSEIAIKSAEIRKKTGTDPLGYTQKPDVVMDTWYKIKNKQLTSFQELWDVFKSGPENQPAFSWGDMIFLENTRLQVGGGTSANSVETRYRSRLFEHFSRDGKLPPDMVETYRKANDELTEALKGGGDIETKFEKILTEVKDVKAKKHIALWRRFYTPSPPVTLPFTGRIKVISPDGTTGTISRSSWPEAEKEGYKRVE